MAGERDCSAGGSGRRSRCGPFRRVGFAALCAVVFYVRVPTVRVFVNRGAGLASQLAALWPCTGEKPVHQYRGAGLAPQLAALCAVVFGVRVVSEGRRGLRPRLRSLL